MSTKQSLDQIKQQLWLKSSLRGAADNEPITRGIENVPVNMIFKQAQYIENNLLPKIESQHGKDSEQYRTFRDIFKSLLWCIAVIDRYDALKMKCINTRLLMEFYRDNAEKTERELMKYTTMEDFFLSDALDIISDGIKKRTDDLLNPKPNV